MAHETVVCSCGARIGGCRCPHPHKSMRVVENGCSACRELASMQITNSDSPAVVPPADYGPGYTQR